VSTHPPARFSGLDGRQPDAILPAHVPHRGSDVEAWLKRIRDGYPRSGLDPEWNVVDDILENYREHADTGVPLFEEVSGPGGDPA
jgi:hypothetical protein